MKHATLRDRLYARIRATAPGTRMPSVRELMRSFKVSQATVDRAILELKRDGLVYSRPGDGTYVARSTGARGARGALPPRSRVMLAVSDYPSPFLAQVAERMAHTLQADGLAVRSLRFGRDQRLAALLRRGGCDAFVLMAGGGALQLMDLSSLARLSVPGVILDRDTPLAEFDTVGTDNTLGGALAARHLVELGHRRLAALASEPETSITMRTRIKAFCDQARLMRAESVEVIESHTQRGERAVAKAHATLSETFARRKPDFTGLFVVSDTSALGALKACHDAGIDVPGKMSVIGFDGLAEGEYYQPALTTLRQDLDAWARAASDLIRRRLDGDRRAAECRAIKPEVVIRASTRSLRTRKKRRK